MIRRLINAARLATALVLLSLNTVMHVLPLLVASLFKVLLRFEPVRGWLDIVLIRLAESWIGVNSWMFDHLTETRIDVQGLPEVNRQGHLLVICNHQSWVDIPVLQKLFNRRLPLLRFFLKSQLIWVPLLGLAWWALDFPFMKRYSKEALARRPELAGRDIKATREACRKFRRIPVAVMNFVEGTRYTPAKARAQQSPYPELLRPRSGGVAFVLDALAESIDTIIDVTIAYPGFPGQRPGLIDLCANRIPEIRIAIRTLPVPEWARGLDYQGDPGHRARFQEWINELWREKHATLERLLASTPTPAS